MNYKEFKDLSKLEQTAVFEAQTKRKKFLSKRLYGIGVCDVAFPIILNFEGKQAVCPAYTTWQNMLRRCYYTKNTTNYSPATVCDEWHKFSNFLEWWKLNYVETWELDKDFRSLLMFQDTCTKLYSPETCRFIPKWMNLVHRNRDGKLLNIGQAD